MAILDIRPEFAGQAGVKPRLIRVYTDDSFDEVTTTNYLDPALVDGGIDASDIFMVTSGTASDTTQYFKVTVSGNDYTLSLLTDTSVLPVITGNIPIFSSTTGILEDSTYSFSDLVFLSPASGTQQLNGTTITYKDNATSFRLKGPSSPNDPSAGADVQTYAGMFYNDSYSNFGTLKTRASYGANLEMDLALQSPHALLLIAQDGSQTDGVIKCASQTQVQFHTRYSAEQEGVSYGFFDRTDTGSTGDANTSAVTLSTNTNHLFLQNGATTQAIVLPKVEDGNVTNLTAGILIYDTTTNKLMFYNGSGWETVTSS